MSTMVTFRSSSTTVTRNSPLNSGVYLGTPVVTVVTAAAAPDPVKEPVDTTRDGRSPLFSVNVTSHVKPFSALADADTLTVCTLPSAINALATVVPEEATGMDSVT